MEGFYHGVSRKARSLPKIRFPLVVPRRQYEGREAHRGKPPFPARGPRKDHHMTDLILTCPHCRECWGLDQAIACPFCKQLSSLGQLASAETVGPGAPDAPPVASPPGTLTLGPAEDEPADQDEP